MLLISDLSILRHHQTTAAPCDMMLTFFCQITNAQHCAANYNWVAEHPKVMDINPPNFLIQSNAKTGEVVLYAQMPISLTTSHTNLTTSGSS